LIQGRILNDSRIFWVMFAGYVIVVTAASIFMLWMLLNPRTSEDAKKSAKRGLTGMALSGAVIFGALFLLVAFSGLSSFDLAVAISIEMLGAGFFGLLFSVVDFNPLAVFRDSEVTNREIFDRLGTLDTSTQITELLAHIETLQAAVERLEANQRVD